MAAREVTPPFSLGGALGRPADPYHRYQGGAHQDRRLHHDPATEDEQRREGERRRHQRLLALGLTIEIDRSFFALKDLSLGGFRAGPYAGPLAAGQPFEFTIRLSVDGAVTILRSRAQTLRIANEELVAVYAESDPEFFGQLGRFLERERLLRLSYAVEPDASPPRPAFVSETA